MIDTTIILFFPFLLSLIGTFLFSQGFLSQIDSLSLQGTFLSRTKKKRIKKNAGSVVLFAGSSLSIIFVIALGFVPPPVFIKILLLGLVLVLVGLNTKIRSLNAKSLFCFKLLFAIIVVTLLQSPFLKLDGVLVFTLAVGFAICCVYFVSILNLMKRTAILFSISVTVFGAVLGIYIQDTVLIATNFSVLGSLLAFSYFNFSESRKIELGFTGEMLIGFAITAQGMYLYASGIETTSFKNFLPFAILLFLYPVGDALQYFAIKGINKVFNKKMKECQIHEYFSSANMPKTNAMIILVFAFVQFFVLASILLNFGFM
ncbi:hypothetical protein N8274_01045 [Flavobacteriaceae bacterium]|nr:hypothetical protein [Flavobacteriaceae bacterium]